MRAAIYDPATGNILQTAEGAEANVAATAAALGRSALDVGDLPDDVFRTIDATHRVVVLGGEPQLEEIGA